MFHSIGKKKNGRYFTYSEYALQPVVFAEYAKPDGYDSGASLNRKEGQLGNRQSFFLLYRSILKQPRK